MMELESLLASPGLAEDIANNHDDIRDLDMQIARAVLMPGAPVPTFTADIDAAAQLVPAGFWWRLLCSQDGRYHPEVGRQAEADEPHAYANGCVIYDDANGYSFVNGALGLCLTALRATARAARAP